MGNMLKYRKSKTRHVKNLRKTSRTSRFARPRHTKLHKVSSKVITKEAFTDLPRMDFMGGIRKYVLGDLPEQERFVTYDGKSLNSIYELIEALATMSDETYNYHVNIERNDFSEWIANSLKEPQLAETVRRCKSMYDMRITLMKFLTLRF